jgi:hypothetical protein
LVKFCRNCGKQLATADDKVCQSCEANAVKGTTYCRYCAHPTSVDDATCPHCGAAIKPLPSNVRTLFEYPRLSAKMGKIINLSIVAILVTLYVVFSLPKTITKPIKAAAADAVFASTGYSALPLNSISVNPIIVPRPNNSADPANAYYFDVNGTWPLTVYAVYKSTTTLNTSANTTTGERLEVVTTNCSYQSSNPKVATVDTGGVVHAVSVGFVRVTISYTAAPGSANMSDAAQGKVPITVTTSLPVTVNAGVHDAHGRPQ